MHNLVTPGVGYVLVTPQDHDPLSSNIIIANKQEMPFQRGKVLAVGQDYLSNEGTVIKPWCDVGDTILYRYQGFENVEIEGETYRLIAFAAIVGKFTK